MKRRIALIVAGVALMGAAWLLIENRPTSAGPVYQGKPAREWLGEIFTTNQANAMTAFREMGTNAFPILIRELKKNDSLLDWMNRWIYPRLPAALQSHWKRPVVQQTIWSAAGLVLLNNRHSHDVFPELVQIVENKHYHSRRDVYSLAIGLAGPKDKACVPELTARLEDDDIDTRTVTAVLLWKIDGQTNAAVTALKTAIDSKEPSYMKDYAPFYLYQIHPLDASLIPLFIADLQGTNFGLGVSATSVLEHYGPAAAAAIPALTNLLNSSNFPSSLLHEHALETLKNIDPAAAAKYETK